MEAYKSSPWIFLSAVLYSCVTRYSVMALNLYFVGSEVLLIVSQVLLYYLFDMALIFSIDAFVPLLMINVLSHLL